MDVFTENIYNNVDRSITRRYRLITNHFTFRASILAALSRVTSPILRQRREMSAKAGS